MFDLALSPPYHPGPRSRATGTKRALKPVQVWGIRIRFQVQQRLRDLPLFDLALDSKLRGCDLIALKISDVTSGNRVRSRAMVLQRKTGRPVQFEITEQTRRSIAAWIGEKQLSGDDWPMRKSGITPLHAKSSREPALLPSGQPTITASERLRQRISGTWKVQPDSHHRDGDSVRLPRP